MLNGRTHSLFRIFEPNTPNNLQITEKLSIFISILARARASAWAGVSSSEFTGAANASKILTLGANDETASETE